MTRIRLVAALLIVAALGLFAAGCKKPFLVPTAFDLNANGGFYLERYFGQLYEDDDEQVHMSTGVRMWISKEIPISSPVDGIMEWCPPGVWCDQAQGYGTVRVTLKPKKDQINEIEEVKAVPQYVLIGGLQASEVRKAVKALYLAEEADDPLNPSEAEVGDAQIFSEKFIKYSQEEPEAYVVRMGDVLGKPRGIGAASLGPRGRITITVLDPKGYYLDPMIYLNLGLAPQSAPVQALDGDTTPPQITQVTMYAHGSMSGNNALGIQTVNIGGTSVPAVVVPTASVPGDPALFDITVGVRDVGPPRCDADGGTETAPPVVTCEAVDAAADPTRAIKQIDVEIFGLDPLAPPPSPTVSDYIHPMLATPYQAGPYCLAEANARLDGSGESDIGSDLLYNPFEPPVTKTSPHVYNLANLRARPDADCLPETWRDEEEETEGAIDTASFPEGEYKVVVTVTDFAAQTDVHESWIRVTSSPPGCNLEISSCTGEVSFGDTSASACGSGDLLTAVNLSLDIPPPSAICQGTATLQLGQGNVEVFLNPDCTGPITLPYQWDLAAGEVVPSQVFLRAGLDGATTAPVEFQEIVLQFGYTNGATCAASANTVLQGGSNSGPADYEGGCCTENGSPGCETEGIAACVCAIDSACCTGNWTEDCIALADNSCNANCPAIDSECGNGVCEINENPSMCPGDCQGSDDINDPVAGFESCLDLLTPSAFAISNSTLVPFSVDWTSGGVAFTGQDDQGLCSYEYVPPSLEIKTETLFVKTMDLSQVTLAWKEQAPVAGSGGSQEFASAVVTWEGEQAVGTFGVVEGKVTEVTLALNNQGQLSGIVDFEVATTADANLGTNAILRHGLYGTFSFAFGGDTDWTGNWNFGGIEGIHIDLVRGTDVLASATGVLQPTGVLEATLVQAAPITFTTFGVTAQICDLSVGFNYNIANSQLDFLSGGGALSTSGFAGLDGSIDLVLDFAPTQVTVGLGLGLGCSCCATGASTIEVVGMEISNLSLTGVFSYDFDLISLVGTASAQHPDFDTAIEGVVVKLEDLPGATGLGISEFSMASFTTGFQGFELSVTNASYITAGSELTFSAKLVIPPLGQFTIINFKCNDAGLISIQKITGALTQAPLTGTFQASYEDNGTTSRFTGYINNLSIAGLVTVGASIDVGTALSGSSPFTFIYLQIVAAGLPLPFVKKFAAAGGYNYGMDGIAGCPPDPGQVCLPFGGGGGSGETLAAPGYPSLGNYIVGLGIGLGDPAGIIGFDLYVQVQFGSGPTLLSGAAGISIPQVDPWISGTVFINNYELGGDSMAGGISTNVEIPRGDPWFFELNGTVLYESDEGGWSVETPTPIVANLFWGFLEVQGTFNFSSQVSTNPAVLENSFNGHISGSIEVGGSVTFRYPSGFNSATCSTAQATSNSLGLGAGGGIGMSIGGSLGANFDNDGMSGGSFGVHASFNGNVKVKWPCPFGCSSCFSYLSVSASASFQASQTSTNRLRVAGSAYFVTSFGVNVNHSFSHTF
ncbi:MAG: hypothetical protein ACPGU1_04375 [Myxococcota bacterium]